MSGQQDPVTQVSSMPLPPLQYISLYTDENIKRGRAPKPPPPVQDSYVMFGRTFNVDDPIIRPLESQGIKRLYLQNCDRKKELKKINHSLLMNFLDLIDILINAPESPKRLEKLDDISTLFIHMHHLINEYRPHQARETIRVTLELQKKQRSETIIRLRNHLDQACSKLREAAESLPKIERNAELLEMIERIRKQMEPSNSTEAESPVDEIGQLREMARKTNLFPLKFRKIGSLRKSRKRAIAEFHKLERYRRRTALRQTLRQRANQMLLQQQADRQLTEQQQNQQLTQEQPNLQLTDQQETQQLPQEQSDHPPAQEQMISQEVIEE